MRKDYKVITQDSAHELSCNISGYLNKGWSLCGGVATGISNPHSEIPKTFYCQAITRKVDEDATKK